MEGNTNQYLLLKRSGFSADGSQLSATESAKALLKVGFWPLFKRTPCKNIVKPGQKVLIYTAGNEKDCKRVIASVLIDSIEDWSDKKHQKVYPIALDDIPSIVLNFSEINLFNEPILIKNHLDKLDLVPKKNPSKWGMAVMGGMKRITLSDYSILSGECG